MITMDGATPRNISTLDSLMTQLPYHLVAMMGFNTGSNPQVAEVRGTTAGLITTLAKAIREGTPIRQDMDRFIVELMSS